MAAGVTIDGADQVIARFGGWPSFHDAQALSFTEDAVRRVATIVLHTWVMTGRVGQDGFYELENHTLVTLRFDGVEAAALRERDLPSIVFALLFTPEPGDAATIRVTLESSYGMCGTLLCKRVAVTEVTPCDKHGNPLMEPEGSDEPSLQT